jgi:hypothetical protein
MCLTITCWRHIFNLSFRQFFVVMSEWVCVCVFTYIDQTKSKNTYMCIEKWEKKERPKRKSRCDKKSRVGCHGGWKIYPTRHRCALIKPPFLIRPDATTYSFFSSGTSSALQFTVANTAILEEKQKKNKNNKNKNK